MSRYTIPILYLCSLVVATWSETSPICSPPVRLPCPRSRYRSIDGSCNNLGNPSWGMADTPFGRLVPPAYGDGVRSPRQRVNGRALPNARLLRTSFFPAGQSESPSLTLLTMQWGQIVAHDMSILRLENIKCCTETGQFLQEPHPLCMPIHIPKNDATQGKAGISCMNFIRTTTDKETGCSRSPTAPAKPINMVTSYIDLSNVYGNTLNDSNSLRSFSDGKLTTEVRNNRVFPPHDDDPESCPCKQPEDTVCYKTGDFRSNQNSELTILQIMLLREHNRIASELAAYNPHWGDETLFQEARKIHIAAFQHITYYEWLPMLLGRRNMLKSQVIYNTAGFVNDYNPSLSPSVNSDHAHGANRVFHSNIAGFLDLVDKHRYRNSSIDISRWVDRPQVLERGYNLAQLTRGMTVQGMEKTDRFTAEQMADRMSACPGVEFGIDLRATDIQRDRDHALGSYNTYRRFCGLKQARSFADYGDLISPSNIALLKKLYNSPEDVDMSVGGALEVLVHGTQVGPTFLCILQEQFQRTRRSDRFWFENESNGLTRDQLNEIRKSTGAAFFCNNGVGVTSMQQRVFETISDSNPVIDCEGILQMDLSLWKEEVN